jgi:hypothetical protein
MSAFGAKVMTGSILAVIGLITVKVFVAIAAGFLGLLAFLFFKVLPIVLLVWLGLKAFRYLTSDRSEKPAYE